MLCLLSFRSALYWPKLHLKSYDVHLKRTTSAAVNPQVNFSVWPSTKISSMLRTRFLLFTCLVGGLELKSKDYPYQKTSYHKQNCKVLFRDMGKVIGVNLRKFMTTKVIIIVVILWGICYAACYSFMLCLHWSF